VATAFLAYFQKLFTSNSPRGIDECLHGLTSMVTREMNDHLTQPFTAEEVSSALCHMAPLKAPGPDGFAAGFYQENWAFIGEEVCTAATTFSIRYRWIER
jgi:hypothetical protein